MRKADYFHLARIVAEEKHRIMHAWFDDEAERARHLETLDRFARRFAGAASVDRASFLRACGVDS